MHIYLFIAHCCPLQKYALLSLCSGASILTAGAVLELIFWNCVGQLALFLEFRDIWK